MITELESLLLDLSFNKIPPSNIDKTFDEIAINLLQKTQIVTAKKHYLIREIEFYFSSKYYDHQDGYTHSNQYKTVQRQSLFGEWYFHRFKSAATYANQKFRGIDITFGNKDLENFGGILIRQIQAIGSEDIIYGISNIVTEVIQNIGESALHKIASENEKFVFNPNSPLHLEKYESTYDKPIYKSARVIPKPDDKEKDKFHVKLYRYFNNPVIQQVFL